MPNYYNQYYPTQSNAYPTQMGPTQPTQNQIQSGGFISIPNENMVNTYPVAPGNCVTFKVEGLRDMLEKEITGIEKKGNLDTQGLDNLYKLMTALKVTDKCIEREGGESYGYNRSYGGSYARNNSRDYSQDYRMMPWAYDDGMSNERRGRGNSRDESYEESRDNFRNRSNRGRSNESRGSYEYSRDNSRKKMIQKLETLMDDTMSEYERQAIMDCINKIQ